MKTLNRMIRTTSIFLLLALSASIAFAQTPTTIPGKIAYQGKLLESGVPVTGTRTIEFSIPGTAWTETHNSVQITKGLYSVQLGSITPIPATVFSTPAVSLEIAVEGTTLSPQVELLSVPYAYNTASIAGNLVSGKIPAIGQTLTWDGTAWVPGTTQELPMPQMDLEQITGIINSVNGLQVFNTTDRKVYIYVSAESMWKELSYGSGTITVGGGTPLTVTDFDGNVYQTVQIGNQIWMAENLKTSKYNNGTAIPNVTDNTAWSNLTTGAYCWYNNDAAHENPYGKLYNWYAVNTNNLCPTGWHVPSDDEWTALINYLGGENIAGGKLKEIGTTHWNSPNIGATNETGFTALPGGYRQSNGVFGGIESNTIWWSTMERDAVSAWGRSMYYGNSIIATYNDSKKFGTSVRCVKD